MAKANNEVIEFELNYLFIQQKEVFSSLDTVREFYEILYDFDKYLLNSIYKGGLPFYSLTDIEYSSIKTRVAQVVRGIPDDAIKDLEWRKLVGHFLLKAKYWLLEYLEKSPTIESKNDLESIATKINKELAIIGKGQDLLIDYTNLYFFLNAMAGVQKLTDKMNKEDAFEYKSSFGNAVIRNGISVNKGKILTELGQQSIENVTTEILKAKKIELLNDKPMWHFLRGKKPISAIMLDINWLNDFHSRKVIIQSNDSLKVRMRTTLTYSNNYTETKTKYEIVEVLEVISPENNSFNLFDKIDI